MPSESIVKPRPFRGFRAKTVIYIPCDLPSGPIEAGLKKNSRFRKDLRFCVLYMVNNQIVIAGALGAPAATLALEPLIAAGVKDIILLGFCGSLSERLAIADIVSVTRAFSDEGTSKHYRPRRSAFLASAGLRSEVEGVLRASGLEFKRGKIVSTDAPCRETRPWLEKNRRRGAEVVDMETSAVFALAQYHGIRAASLQVVSDELASGKWKSGFSSRLLVERSRRAFFPLLFGVER
jgi:purine-nucleoside phosphorylase